MESYAAEGARSLERVLSRCTFPASGTPVSCAVSGGADSLALLVLARAAGCEVTAIHVDHGLRAGSAIEADVVAGAARRFGAAFERRSVTVVPGPNLEARSRLARYGELPDDVLTGHTADDQAETILMFLMRGTGPEGLAGIDPARRPILALRRAETEQICRDLDLDFVVDPSNDDPSFTRNRVRHELLPLMADIAGRDVVPIVARTAALQADMLATVDRLGELIDPTDARALAAADVALARAALRQWWRVHTRNHYSPDAAALERMMQVANGVSVGCDVVAGWRLQRSGQQLILVPPSATFDGEPGAEPAT